MMGEAAARGRGDRADRARAVRRRRGDEPDDGRRRQRHGRRARHRGRDRAARHARARLARRGARRPRRRRRTCISGAFTVFGEPCRLIQLVPNAFVVRMTRALDELGAEYVGDGRRARRRTRRLGLDESLRAVKLRVWAELGRRRMPVGDAHRHAGRRRPRARPPGRRARRPVRQRDALRDRPPRRLRRRRVGRAHRGAAQRRRAMAS